ncbi:MAG: arginine--tRNA ligase [Bacteroidia bacterium]
MQMELALKSGIVEAFKELYNETIEIDQIKLEATNPDFEGDFTFVTFPFLRQSKKKPEATADEIGKYLIRSIDDLENYNVVKGFLNLELSDQYWLKCFTELNLKKSDKTLDKVMVEYSSPNTNKPLHLGHIRNNLLGYSVSRILEAHGHEVVKVNLVNDRGIHICKSMLAWKKYGNGETPESSGIKGDHLVGKYYVEFDKHYKLEIAELVNSGMSQEEAEKKAQLILEAQEMLRQWEAGDTEVKELWSTMNSWVYSGFEKTYERLGVHFDKYYYESNTYILGKDTIEEGLSKGVFFKKPDGSVWIDLKAEGLDEKLVLRSDGTSVYMTQDIGTALLKYEEFQCDKSVYVVGNEQDYHFKVLFLILKKLGLAWADGCYHLSYGMVDLPSGKMKSREGTVVDADDLMDEMVKTAREKTEELGKTDNMPEDEKEALHQMLGLGALKFFMLKVDPQKRMLFNPQESIDLQGDTGPFVQYTFARIKSMLRAANEDELNSEFDLETAHDSELSLIKVLANYKEEFKKAAEAYNPAIVVAYVLQVAKAFNRVYNGVSFLKEDDMNKRIFRLNLANKTALTIRSCLGVLGIQCPERM